MRMRAAFLTVIIALLSFEAANAADATPPASGLSLTGSLRVRYESWNWFESIAARDSYDFVGSLLRVDLTKKTTNLEWRVEIAQPSLFNLPDDAIAPAPQGQLGLGASYYAANGQESDGGLFVRQANLKFKSIGTGNQLTIGRFDFNEGLERMPKNPILSALRRQRIGARLIGNFGFTHVERTFDGGQFVHDGKNSSWQIVAARPTAGVFNVNGMKEIDVDLLYGSYTASLGNMADWRLFAIEYRDSRHTLKADNRPAAVRQADVDDVNVLTIGGHYIRQIPMSRGDGDVLVWGALQRGDWGTQDHSAMAVALEAGYHVKAPMKPVIRVGYFESSGDDDPTDGDHETFFQILPTPRVYARFPFYNLMNNRDLFVQFALRPHPRLGLSADLHAIGLTERNDLWYVGGGAFDDKTFGYAGRPSRGHDDLGTVIDLAGDFKVNEKLSVALYLSSVAGGDVIDSIYDGDSGRYCYLEMTLKF